MQRPPNSPLAAICFLLSYLWAEFEPKYLCPQNEGPVFRLVWASGNVVQNHWEDLGCINKAGCKQQANDLDKLGPKVFAIGPKQHLDKIDVDNDDSATTVKVFSIEPNGHLNKTEGRTYLDILQKFTRFLSDKNNNYEEDMKIMRMTKICVRTRMSKILILKMMMNSVNCCHWLMITPIIQSRSV